MSQVAPNFRANRKFMGPAWLVSDGSESEKVGYVLEFIRDGFAERLRQGLLTRFPQSEPTGQETAAEDALAAMGRDRRIVRGINETAQSYARRLLTWLDDWRTAGNAFALMKQLAAYVGTIKKPGYTGIPTFRTVDVRGNWFSRDGAGVQTVSLNQANWDWDGAGDALVRWSRFWVVIYPNGVWTEGTKWGDVGAVWGTIQRTWGSTATSDQVASVQGLVSDWKPAGTTGINVIIAFDDSSFNPATPRDGAGLPDGTWGHWGKISGGVRVAARLGTARFWDGA